MVAATNSANPATAAAATKLPPSCRQAYPMLVLSSFIYLNIPLGE
jgi:hypothetical protein